MNGQILGFHHITAISADIAGNFDFYTNVLQLKHIKSSMPKFSVHRQTKGKEDSKKHTATLGFFQVDVQADKGRKGSGMITQFGYSVPQNSLDFWMERLNMLHIPYNRPLQKFGEKYITISDPDGLRLEIFETASGLPRADGEDLTVPDPSITGFHQVTLMVSDIEPTAKILTEVLGYHLLSKGEQRYRYTHETLNPPLIIELVVNAKEKKGLHGIGTVHHLAFRTGDEESLAGLCKKILALGLDINMQKENKCFHSLYFREPGGVLFEIVADK